MNTTHPFPACKTFCLLGAGAGGARTIRSQSENRYDLHPELFQDHGGKGGGRRMAMIVRSQRGCNLAQRPRSSVRTEPSSAKSKKFGGGDPNLNRTSRTYNISCCHSTLYPDPWKCINISNAMFSVLARVHLPLAWIGLSGAINLQAHGRQCCARHQYSVPCDAKGWRRWEPAYR